MVRFRAPLKWTLRQPLNPKSESEFGGRVWMEVIARDVRFRTISRKCYDAGNSIFASGERLAR
jgi:hypothetical protein